MAAVKDLVLTFETADRAVETSGTCHDSHWSLRDRWPTVCVSCSSGVGLPAKM